MTDAIEATLNYRSKVIRPVLDLTINAWVKQHGDLTVFGTWWLDTDGEAPWPCLVIVPTHKSMAHSYIPCVVTIDLAHIWAEETATPEDTQYAMEKAISFADSLGLTKDWKTVNRLASIIRGHIGDLLAIPPRPVSLERVVADAILKSESGKELHAELKDV